MKIARAEVWGTDASNALQRQALQGNLPADDESACQKTPGCHCRQAAQQTCLIVPSATHGLLNAAVCFLHCRKAAYSSFQHTVIGRGHDGVGFTARHGDSDNPGLVSSFHKRFHRCCPSLDCRCPCTVELALPDHALYHRWCAQNCCGLHPL